MEYLAPVQSVAVETIVTYLITTLLASIVGALVSKGTGIHTLRVQIQALIESQKGMLYENLVKLYLEHHDNRGWASVPEKESYERLYKNWVNLGNGSDVIKRMYEGFMRLPTEKPDKEKEEQ